MSQMKAKSKYTNDNFVPIKNITNGEIILDSNEKVTGIKIMPKNIFIMDYGAQIAAIENLKNSPLYKAEIITFSKKGQITDDFIGLQAYCYTYWGSNVQAIGMSFENRFYYGYNPSKTKFGTLKEGPNVTFNGAKTLALGGDRSKPCK